MNKNFILLAISLLVILLTSTGCSKALIYVDIHTNEHVNPDINGRPSPIIVRVYELKSAAPFESADFFELYENDITLLGQDLVHREEYTLRPGDKIKYLREPSKEVEYLAVIAAFQNLDKSIWRQIVALPKNKKLKATIFVDSLAVSIKSATDRVGL